MSAYVVDPTWDLQDLRDLQTGEYAALLAKGKLEEPHCLNIKDI